MRNKKLYLVLSILYPFWLLISFVAIYFLMTREVMPWYPFAFFMFEKYLFFVFPISIIWLIFILTKGHFSEIKNKIKSVLVVSAVLLVLGFTMIEWVSVTTRYGQYGTSVKHSPEELFLLYVEPKSVTPFEYVTLYREAMESRYDSVFRKIWTFDGIVFFSTFLILYVMKKNESD